MIVGAWPPELTQSDTAGCKVFAERLAGWQQKALREAKLRTDWTTPNETYEATARDFLFSLFEPNGQFLSIAQSFIDTIAPAGAVNSLAQTVLKMSVPGMPDFFQGTEFWDFSLVDPDNRRPVDYAARRQVKEATAQSWRNGRIKQAVIRQVLAFRRRTPDLFAHGDYSPLPVKGPLEDHIVAFTRAHGRSALIVVVPRLVHGLLQDDSRITLNPSHLQDNTLLLPEQLHGRPINAVLGSAIKTTTAGPELQLLPLLADFPLAVLDLG
jgi:(1->4)-alpha-D-glucan 1-alpha-D-glucosylmutase